MININNITVNTSGAKINRVKLELIADENACHMVVDYTITVDGFEQKKQFALHGEEFNAFWSTYESDSNFVTLLANKSGLDLDSNIEFSNSIEEK